MPKPSFDFAAMDSILRAQARGRQLPPAHTYEADRIGPWLELKLAIHDLPAAQRIEIESTVTIDETTSSHRVCSIDQAQEYDAFRVDAHLAALNAGFQSSTAAKIVAALTELGSNVLEHSERPQSGRLAFRAGPNAFEFVVADLGIGPLASLRQYDGYSNLVSHGEALSLMMEEGVSRFGPNASRGFGYRPLFVWLANLTGHLRFRAGDQAFELDGRFGDTLAVRLSQKPPIRGYFASICCLGPA